MEIVKRHVLSQIDLAIDSEVLHTLWQKALAALQSLQTPLGVKASGQDDQFHAIFGRDSLWTVLLALEADHPLLLFHIFLPTIAGCMNWRPVC